MVTPVRPPAAASRNALEAWLAAAAAADPQLCQNLLHDPATTLEHLFGRKLPADIHVAVVAEAPADLYLVRRFEAAGEPIEPDGAPAQVLRTAIHAVAMTEDGFWDKLAANAKPVLAERLALPLPAGVRVHVLNEDAHTAYVVLPHAPHLAAWRPPAQVLQHLPVRR